MASIYGGVGVRFVVTRDYIIECRGVRVRLEDTAVESRYGDGLSRPAAVWDAPSVYGSCSIRLIRCYARRLHAYAPSHA
jgi:hypothetical protein